MGLGVHLGRSFDNLRPFLIFTDCADSIRFLFEVDNLALGLLRNFLLSYRLDERRLLVLCLVGGLGSVGTFFGLEASGLLGRLLIH
jgi:hypothetical protein